MNLIDEYEVQQKLYGLAINEYVVYFRLLPLKKFKAYWEVIQKDLIAAPIVENMIFQECVLDKEVADNSHTLPAGIVSTVAGVILAKSGPTDIDSFNDKLNQSRAERESLLAKIEILICKAFPAYKPEDLLGLNWDKLMLRLAQAEEILLTRNPPELSEPIKLTPNEPEAPEKFDINKEMAELPPPEFRDFEPVEDKPRFQPDRLTPEQIQKIQELRNRKRGQ
jgi:hypothetical protein